MEWSDVKAKIAEYLEEDISEGLYSDEGIRKSLDEELGSNWTDNKAVEEAMIEDRRNIQEETERLTTIGECALSEGEVLFVDRLNNYILQGGSSLTEKIYTNLIMRDIDEFNNHIRKLLYSEAKELYPKDVNGLANIAKERCFGEALESQVWENYFNVQKSVFTIFMLSSFIDDIQGNEIDNLARFEQIYDTYHKEGKMTILTEDLYAKALKVLKHKPDSIFTSKYNAEQLLTVKEKLERYKYIAPTTNDNFLYWFGEELCTKPVQLEWIKRNTQKNIDRQAITELIVLLCGKTNSSAIKSCFGIEEVLKNYPGRFVFDTDFYRNLKKIGIE